MTLVLLSGGVDLSIGVVDVRDLCVRCVDTVRLAAQANGNVIARMAKTIA